MYSKYFFGLVNNYFGKEKISKFTCSFQVRICIVAFSYSDVFVLLFVYLKMARKHHVFSSRHCFLSWPFTAAPSLAGRAGDGAGDRSSVARGTGNGCAPLPGRSRPTPQRLAAATRRAGAEVAPALGSGRVPPTEAGRAPLGIASRRRLRRGTPEMEGSPPSGWQCTRRADGCDRGEWKNKRTNRYLPYQWQWVIL
jgi:hypothetical protein